MRRFLTLICLLCLAIPAGISISGCTRNPGANYCNGLGYGTKITDVAVITLPPVTGGISIAYGQTRQISTPSAVTCKGTSASAGTYTYGTSNNELVDISPTGNMCAGTWNRNSGGGIPNYTVCSPPNPLPTTGGLPYSTAYVTASAQAVVSNPVQVYLHTQVTSVGLVTESISTGLTNSQCYSQGQQALLDGQACYANSSNQQVQLCAPASISQCPYPSGDPRCNSPLYFACSGGAPNAPNIIASGTFTAPLSNGVIQSAQYASGGTVTGAMGQTCTLSNFNNGSAGATATVTLSGANTIGSFTPLLISAGGSGATAAPTSATLSNGTATCSGTATINSSIYLVTGTAGQTCTLSNFNGSTGATATVALSGANTIAGGTPLTITAGGVNAPAPPTTATLSNGTATCSGSATVGTVLTQVPNCTAALGSLSYSVGVSSVASITTNTNTNLVTITAAQPGTTPITASVAGSGSSAGFFSTCPPKSISVTLPDGTTSGTIALGSTPQNLTTTITDTNNRIITGLSLDYQSTDPVDISTGSSGTITTSSPGVASIYAICQPGSCNPTPTQQIGSYGTGLPITSNKVTVTTPGTAGEYLWFVAPGQSRYVVPFELLPGVAGSVGSTTRLPYVPNSAAVDRLGNNIYMGSDRELMVFSTASGSVTTQNVNVPGVVLAVAPDGSQVLINNQQLHYLYLFNTGSSSYTTISGMGAAAAWTPDTKTLYITDSAALNVGGITGHTDTLYVYNQNTGWTTHDLSTSTGGSLNLAVTIPSVGAYLSGSSTVAHTWCPTGTVGNYGSMIFYPQADSVEAQTDILAATTDGEHILGAAYNSGNVTLNDIGLDILPTECTLTSALSTNGILLTPAPLNVNVNATAINQLVASPASNLAFITYNGTTAGAQLPYYVPNAYTPGTGTPGTLGYLKLTGSAVTAPLAGAFSPDDKYFFVSTSGDNMIHYISIPANVSPATPPTDTQQIAPNLPACSSTSGLEPGCNFTGTGTYVPATFIAVKPRPTT